jgi:thiol-disulfide isomerase/thioredoxin
MSVRCLLALVLAAAAIGKARRRSELAEFARILRVGLRLPGARTVAAVWVAVEGGTAIALALPQTVGYAAALAAAEFGCLTAGAAVLAAQHRGFACACFGAGQSQLSWWTVLRNGALTGAALLLAAAPRLHDGYTVPTLEVMLAAVLTVLLGAVLVGQVLILRSLRASPPAGRLAMTAVALPASGPEVGSAAPPFTALTSAGTVLDATVLAGHTFLLAFVSSTCEGCRNALPGMIGYASQLPAEFRLITVIVGDRQRGVDIERALTSVATVVSEPSGGPISAAYRIHLFPSYVLVDDTGTVVATGQSVRDLPLPQPQ